ncbi:MAG: hypothetical protein DYH13_07675 [Alphaproteobacteria bacterium PRO2]|nr:hypothetical protein [Alphaproteobacteria bacterium PRO2]
MFPTPILKKICNDLMNEGNEKESNWRRGGEGNNMEMVLVQLGKILTLLQNFSGKGDAEFLTRRQRKENL